MKEFKLFWSIHLVIYYTYLLGNLWKYEHSLLKTVILFWMYNFFVSL